MRLRDDLAGGQMVFVQQIASETNNVNIALDEFDSTSRMHRQRRQELLARAISASERGVVALAKEPLILDSHAYLEELSKRHDANPFKIHEELRQDAALLRWFLEAECRLLGDLGVSQGAVEKIRKDMLAILTEDLPAGGEGISPDELQKKLSELLRELQRDSERLEDEKNHDAILRRVRGVLEVLGGGLVIVVDTAAVPASGPLAHVTAEGAALSIALGTTAIDRGLSLARSS